jgi:hypothetical protein
MAALILISVISKPKLGGAAREYEFRIWRVAGFEMTSRESGGAVNPDSYCAPNTEEHHMRKFHSIAALCGDGLRPELQALFDRLAIDPQTELLVRKDGMIQSGPDPDLEATKVVPASPRRAA